MLESIRTVSVKTTWERPYIPVGGLERAYLLVEVRGSGTRRGERPPLNLALVLDRSGSMAGAPIEYSKRACRFVADQMREGDRLRLVAFDDEVQTIDPPTKERIAAIQPGGSTNLSGGLMEGAQQVRRSVASGTTNRVILLSDGHANHGITSKPKLGAIAKEYLAAGVSVTTMGVGDGFDEELLETIAELGGGRFYYIGTAEEIPSIFERELDGLLSTVAHNLKLTLRPAEGTSVTNVYGAASESDSRGTIVSLGDLGDGAVKTLLVELSIESGRPGRRTALALAWEYADVTDGAEHCRFAAELPVEFTNDGALLSLPRDPEVTKQAELTRSALAIESAMAALDGGRSEEGQRLLREQAERLREMASALNAPSLAAESELLSEQLESFSYDRAARKKLHAQKYRQMKGK
ncbi:vWA domain-containing protein [Paenibacillus antri]|nr:VWA domain-containing protein [Paenibacillus antri]